MSSENDAIDKDDLVRVAVRIRPQNSREVIDMCRVCTSVTPGEQQIVLGSDKAFTFDYVYDIDCNQCEIYGECVDRLVEGTLRGYNATVLAYGQTGSGKTYTMGTGFDQAAGDHQLGIIPRAIRHIFAGIDDMQRGNEDMTVSNIQFTVGVQFIELYNEDIKDLLDPFNKNSSFRIQENSAGQISIVGATIKPINEPQDALKILKQGALARTTASTNMNDLSSRSHAVFTLFVRRQQMLEPTENFNDSDMETLTSKFHFVDLAGSERLKRTLATGERAREGISINCGLLALGNCISALGDKSKKASHVPYRDSKLTRLLQDSLGGNSQTLMIACISPSDRDFMETLNTLKYANRARNIKNKVQINQDQSSRTISLLRRDVAALQLELLEYKQGKRIMDSQGNISISDTFHENTMLSEDNKRLQQRLKSMQSTMDILIAENAQLKAEKETYEWSSGNNVDADVKDLVGGYILEMEKLRTQLRESEDMCQQLQKAAVTSSPRAKNSLMEDTSFIIDLAKKNVEKEREQFMSRSLPSTQQENVPDPLEVNESDSDANEIAIEMEENLDSLNTDIILKTQLIEHLEQSQERISKMRQQYEDKMAALNQKIYSTQKERDEILANMGKDNLKSVKIEYERKLTDLNRELANAKEAQRNYNRQQKISKAQELKLNNLRSELNALKCSKVKLMKRMAEQSTRHKEEDSRKNREIAQLRKQTRRQDNAFQNLQAKVQVQDQVLKRRSEEVAALRRSQRSAASVRRTDQKPQSKSDQNRNLHQRWEALTRYILHAARNKQLTTQLESELERLVNEREELCRELTSIQEATSYEKVPEYSNEEDNLKANIGYLQENIEHVQKAIMESEDVKDPGQSEATKMQNIFDSVKTFEEANYLLQKLAENAIHLTCNCSMIENRMQEHEALLLEAQRDSCIKQQLLQYFLDKNTNMQIPDRFDSLKIDERELNTIERTLSQRSLFSNETYDVPQDEALDLATFHNEDIAKSRGSSPFNSAYETSSEKNLKVRGRTARRQDLLFGDAGFQK